MTALDLFGEPVTWPVRSVGRPRHHPTEETRRAARQLAAEAATHDEIARAIGITAPTLRMHYHAEIGSSSKVWKRRAVGAAK